MGKRVGLHVIDLEPGLADFFCKGPNGYLGFVGHTVYVVTTPLHMKMQKQPQTICPQMGMAVFQ